MNYEVNHRFYIFNYYYQIQYISDLNLFDCRNLILSVQSFFLNRQMITLHNMYLLSFVFLHKCYFSYFNIMITKCLLLPFFCYYY